MLYVIIIAAMLLSTAVPSLAQERLIVGNSYSGNVKLSSPNNGIYLALPEGTWILTSLEETRTNPGNSPFINGRLVSMDDQKRVLGAASFSAGNMTNSNSRWNVPSFCDRKDIFFLAAPDKMSGRKIRCWGVNHIGMTPGSKDGKYVTDFYQWVAKNTVGMPKTMIAVDFYRASEAKYLHTRYFRNPELDGFPHPHVSAWRESEWHKDSVVGDQKRLSYLEGVKAWGEQWLPTFEAAFNGRPISQPKATPVAAPISNSQASMERRLEELKSLFDKKLITGEEYAEKRKDMVNKNVP